jgi:hypothetical protein
VFFVDTGRPANHLGVGRAGILPQFGVVDEVALFLSNTAQQLIKASTVIELIQKADEEIHVARCVYEMPARAFKLWPPDLDSERFREYLRHFMLCGCCCGCILLVIINDMGSLKESA